MGNANGSGSCVRVCMELLKIQEGPEVGEALQYLQEIRFQKGPITQGEAEKAIRNWWDEKKTVPKTNS